MHSMLRRSIGLGLASACMLLAACSTRPTAHALAPLAAVAQVAKPTVQAPVAGYSPTGIADPRAQIRITFASDMLPIEQLESPAEQTLLRQVHIEPAVAGAFRMLTPRMIGFQSDAPFPTATRIRVTLDAGVHDLAGHALASPFAWTFATEPIAITDFPKNDASVDLKPAIRFASNVPLDPATINGRARLETHDGSSISLDLAMGASPTPTETNDAPPEGDADQSNGNVYRLTPRTALAPATTYTFVLDAGMAPKVGNLPTTRAVRGSLRTYDTLRFDGPATEDDAPTYFTSGSILFRFSNAIDEKSLAEIHVDPAPRVGDLVQARADGTIALNATLLNPDTDYAITFGAQLRDRFGQTLGHDERATFRTADRTPSLWAPSGIFLFPRNAHLTLDARGLNLGPRDVRARLRRLDPRDIIQYGDAQDGGGVLKGVADVRIPFPDRPNVEQTYSLPIGPTTTAYALDAPVQHTSYAGLIERTDIGAFAEYFARDGFVRVDRISTGAPIANADITVFPSQTDAATKTEPVACAHATTDADGLARLDQAVFAGCAALIPAGDHPPSLVTIVHVGDDWTYVATDASSGAYVGEIDNGYAGAKPLSRGTIFSDRNLYQPGESAALTAVGWFLRDGRLERGTAANYGVTVEGPSGQRRELPRMTLNRYGTAAIAVTFPNDAPLGYYTIRAHAGNGEELVGSLRVAEFKPPNFKVDIAADAASVVPGASVHVRSTSTYLFGPPVQGATTDFAVTRSRHTTTWSGDGSFTFGPQWFWPENEPPIETNVTTVTQPVDAAGSAATAVTIPSDLPYAMDYRFDAETTDVAGLASGTTTTVVANPTPTQIGLKTPFVARAGTPAEVLVLALDARGALVPEQKVHLDLQRATYAQATKVVEGSETSETTVTYATVAGVDVTTSSAPVAAALTPDRGGAYRIRASPIGATANAAMTDTLLYVAGTDADWIDQDATSLPIKLDRATYRIGGQATALVRVPFTDADVQLAVVRNGVLWERRMRVRGGSANISFPVTAAMLPNAAVQAIAVRHGPPPATAPADGGNALARSGVTGFTVDLADRYLTLRANAVLHATTPNTAQTVRVHLEDRSHHGVPGAVTLIVANEAILRLSDYHAPDLVTTVYAPQPISMRYADNRATLALAKPQMALEKGFGYGGGVAAGAEDTRVRHNFQPLAFYAAAQETDANGDATVHFTLPDDLTTWRVMAVAADDAGRFGTSESTFITTKPLVANPALPQFARPGDTFFGGVALTHGPAISGDVDFFGTLLGPLAFRSGGSSATTVNKTEPLGPATRALRVPIAVTGTGTAMASFRATVHGSSRATDAFAVPLPIVERAVNETVATLDATSASAHVPVEVAIATPRDSGGLEVTLANSIIPEFTVAASDAFADETAITPFIAARLEAAAGLHALRASLGIAAVGRAVPAEEHLVRLVAAQRPVDLDRRATLERTALLRLQRSDGGFGFYTGATVSDPDASFAALQALAKASAAGYPVAIEVRERAADYVARALADPAAVLHGCTSIRCRTRLRLHALEALAANGDRRSTWLGDIIAERSTLGLSDTIALTTYLTTIPAYAADATKLGDTLVQRISLDGTLATFVGTQSWYDAPQTQQALVLQLLIARHADGATIDRATRALLAARRSGGWQSPITTATMLAALSDVAKAAGPPPALSADVHYGSTPLGTAHFTHAASTATFTLSMHDLPRGRGVLDIAKSGAGTLHYTLAYTYRLAPPQPGRLHGLRITRTVRAAGSSTPLAVMGLQLPATTPIFDVAHVFDVELEVITDHPIDGVAITDPLAAGFEAVDATFATVPSSREAPASSWDFAYQIVHRDRVEAYADRLDPGRYIMHYTLRSVTPGTFTWPGAEARAVLSADVFGRSAATTVTLR